MFFFFFPILERTRDWVYMSVERYDRKSGDMLIDFLNPEEFDRFSIMGFPTVGPAGSNSASMVVLRNCYQKRIYEGAVYIINKRTIDQWIERDMIREVTDSLLIRFEVNMSEFDGELFDRDNPYAAWTKYVTLSTGEGGGDIGMIAVGGTAQFDLVVRNVGQGNWNELVDANGTLLVYDAGTHWNTPSATVSALAATRDTQYQNDGPGVVISHWDVDHYYVLLSMSDAALRAFRYFLCRRTTPNMTSTRLLNRMLALNPNVVITLDPEPRPGWYSPPPQLIHRHNGGYVQVFNAERHRDRNRSGIVISVQRPNSCAILSGDHHYYKIANAVLPMLNPTLPHHLVVPHHGGNAGTFTYHTHAPGQAVISVGTNSYGHPNGQNITHLQGCGFAVTRTDVINADIVIPLP